jgi:uncharacterized protein YggE
MGAVLESVRREGVADKDVQTDLFQIQPVYEQDKRGNPHPSGFRVSNRVAIKVRDLKKVGRLLSVVTAAGANSVTGPNFEFDNPSQLEREALAKAMEDAKAKASTLAQAAGAALGEALTISQTGNAGWPPPRPVMAMRAKAFAESADTPIAAGEQGFTAEVSVTFALR